jgi:hypothetical protein
MAFAEVVYDVRIYPPRRFDVEGYSIIVYLRNGDAETLVSRRNRRRLT